MIFGLPFISQKRALVYLPTEFTRLSQSNANQAKEFRRLIEENQKSIGRELGCPLSFAQVSGATNETQHARWLIGPTDANSEIQKLNLPLPNGPQIYIDRKRGLLVSDGTNSEEVMQTFSWLRALGKQKDGLWQIKNCSTTEDAIARIKIEIESSFPAFALRQLNWETISQRHIPLVKAASDPIPAMQRWLADLCDAHTWVRPIPGYGQFPYDLIIENGCAYFYRINEESVAWKAGVRPGFELLGENVADWWSRTSASAHAKPFVVGARLLATPVGDLRRFRAKSPDKKIIEWEETSVANRWTPLAKWQVLSSGTAYLRIEAWMPGQGLEEDIDRAFESFKHSPKLIVDLRAMYGPGLGMQEKFEVITQIWSRCCHVSGLFVG